MSIVSQVASALDAAHAHGLVHRDVKPANMLLGTVGTGSTPDHVYLSDFGLSKLSVAAVSLTGTGQFLGTIDYMSPEQVEGRPIDGRTDLYALACAAFEMLTGRPPFQRDQDLAVMWAQVSAPPPSACQLRPDLPPEVDEVIARALAKSPENRQSSCLEFAAQLRAACTARPGHGPGRPELGWPPCGRVRRDRAGCRPVPGRPDFRRSARCRPARRPSPRGCGQSAGRAPAAAPPRATGARQYPPASGYGAASG